MLAFAQFENLKPSERRNSVRKRLRLGATLVSDGKKVHIHNISATGLLLETESDLSLSDQFEVELPLAGPTIATVVWNSGRFFGCQFKHPLASSAISAALLQSSPAQPSSSSPAASREEPYDLHDDDAVDDRFSLTVRLRFILAFSAVSWALIVWAAWMCFGRSNR
jgi:PilZ domain